MEGNISPNDGKRKTKKSKKLQSTSSLESIISKKGKKSAAKIVQDGEVKDIVGTVKIKSVQGKGHRYSPEFNVGVDLTEDPMEVAFEMYKDWWNSGVKRKHILKKKYRIMFQNISNGYMCLTLVIRFMT